jgi:hypothetical protein
MPMSENFFVGLLNLRGEIIPIVSFRKYKTSAQKLFFKKFSLKLYFLEDN